MTDQETVKVDAVAAPAEKKKKGTGAKKAAAGAAASGATKKRKPAAASADGAAAAPKKGKGAGGKAKAAPASATGEKKKKSEKKKADGASAAPAGEKKAPKPKKAPAVPGAPRKPRAKSAAAKKVLDSQYLGGENDQEVFLNVPTEFCAAHMNRTVRSIAQHTLPCRTRYQNGTLAAFRLCSEAFLGHRVDQSTVGMNSEKKTRKTLSEKYLDSSYKIASLENGNTKVPIAMLTSMPRRKAKKGGKVGAPAAAADAPVAADA